MLYLNPDWTAADGGALVVDRDRCGARGPRRVAPRAGTVAVFLSRTAYHSVEPATGARRRVAATLWCDRRA